jgi:hypothetical protein
MRAGDRGLIASGPYGHITLHELAQRVDRVGRRLVLLFMLICVAAFGLAPAVQADPVDGGVEIQTPDRLTVGDRFHYVVTLDVENGTEIGIAPGALPPEFELISTPRTTTKAAGNGRSTLTFDIEIAAFVPGDLTVPPLDLEFKELDGDEGTITTPAGRILVASVLPADGSPIEVRDLKPQLEISSSNAVGIFIAALAAVLVLLIIVAVLIYRSMRPKPVPVAVVADTTEMGAEDRARTILEAAGVAFARDRDFVQYYGTIAVTMRNYLTERYGFHAFALTTVELRNEMSRRGIDRWQARLVDGLLTQCDSAVYARYMPALERADLDLTAAYEIVEMSRPKAELPGDAEATPAEEVGAR